MHSPRFDQDAYGVVDENCATSELMTLTSRATQINFVDSPLITLVTIITRQPLS